MKHQWLFYFCSFSSRLFTGVLSLSLWPPYHVSLAIADLQSYYLAPVPIGENLELICFITFILLVHTSYVIPLLSAYYTLYSSL